MSWHCSSSENSRRSPSFRRQRVRLDARGCLVQMTDVRSEVCLANHPQSNETARNEIAAAGREEKGSGAKTQFAAPARFAQAPGSVRQGRTGARDLARSVRCLESA